MLYWETLTDVMLYGPCIVRVMTDVGGVNGPTCYFDVGLSACGCDIIYRLVGRSY